MRLSINIILDQLREYELESHIDDMSERKFCRAALLHHNRAVIRDDIVYIARLSSAMSMANRIDGITYICVRDRFRDEAEEPEKLKGMIIVNENVDVELLFNMVQDIFMNINEWYCDMQDALIREQSLQHIVDLSTKIIGNTINITDSAFSLLARTSNIETDDEISVNLEKYGYHPESTLQKFRASRRFELWGKKRSLLVNDNYEMSKYIMVNKVFRFHNTYFTHVVMVCDQRELSDGLVQLFEIFTEILAVYAERNWKNKVAFSHNYDSFYVELITGTLSNPADVEERAQYLGITADGPMALLKIELLPGFEDMLGRLGQELLDISSTSQVVLYDNAAVCVVHIRSGAVGFGIDPEQFEQFLKRHKAICGISNTFANLSCTATAYEQASIALKYGSLQKKCPYEEPCEESAKKHYSLYQEEVFYALLGEHSKNAFLWHNSAYYAVVKQIHAYDVAHNSNNMQLLHAYLMNERKATETGQLLHMHRNNVIYRIGRIEKMANIDLNDYNTRIGLEISFLLVDLYGI